MIRKNNKEYINTCYEDYITFCLTDKMNPPTPSNFRMIDNQLSAYKTNMENKISFSITSTSDNLLGIFNGNQKQTGYTLNEQFFKDELTKLSYKKHKSDLKTLETFYKTCLQVKNLMPFFLL